MAADDYDTNGGFAYRPPGASRAYGGHLMDTVVNAPPPDPLVRSLQLRRDTKGPVSDYPATPEYGFRGVPVPASPWEATPYRRM